jgi:hypothetical protein
MSLGAGTYQPLEISFRDAGNEIGTMRFYAHEIDISDDTGNVEELNTLFTTLQTKVAAVVLGAKTRSQYINETLFTTTQPTNGAARELKLFVQLQNNVTGRQLGFTIPTLDGTIPDYIVNKNVKDAISLTSPTAITQLITAIEDIAEDPVDGNDVTVVGLRVVGRNS